MVYAVKQVFYRNFSPETFKNSAILRTFASLPEKKFHESGIRHGILGGVIFWPRDFFGFDLICPHSIIPSNLKSGVPPPGPLGLHPILPKSFIFCFLGKSRELKKHKLNKIKGKCKKKNYFVMTCRYT